MFIWSKGKPNTFNGLREPKEYKDNRRTKAFGRNKDNSVDLGFSSNLDTRLKRNIWRYFAGGGANDKMAKINNRSYIGSDISEEYCIIAQQRIKENAHKLF